MAVLNRIAALTRPEHDIPLPVLKNERVWVTGARGSIGGRLVGMLEDRDVTVFGTDLDVDVRDALAVAAAVAAFKPTIILHLAGAKHAPLGETDHGETATTNFVGTLNVLKAAPIGCRVVVASTCKAVEPETVYGASKLIAERIALSAGHAVARFHNVIETQGNVFDLWAALPDDAPLPVADCERYFITIREACALFLWAAVLPAARYAVWPGSPTSMIDVAARVCPGRERNVTPRRRGDRLAEPLHAACEQNHDTEIPEIVRISSWQEANYE